MSPLIMLIAQLIAVILGPILLAWWLRRRYGAAWSSWGWGALAFVGSQAARLPLLIGSSLLLNPFLQGVDPGVIFWTNLVVLALTSGLFEEGARYIIMRGPARRVRRWNEAVMFGAGHGGIEAMLVVGLSVINAMVLLSLGDPFIEQLRAAVPQQAEIIAAQLATLRSLAWWMPLVALWERAMAIILHIGLSLLVMRAVRAGRRALLLTAMALHAGFNALALLALRYGGITASEIVITLLASVPLLIIARTRRDEAQRGAVVAPPLAG